MVQRFVRRHLVGPLLSLSHRGPPVSKSSTPRGMNLGKLIEAYGSEEKCREFLEALRWPDGPQCPKCDEKSVSLIATRNLYECNSCRYQFSVRAGTVLQDSKLPLWKWF